MTWKKFGSLEINFSWWDLKLKKMAFLHSKNEAKICKNRFWPKMTFRGPIWVPKMSFWGFWGLVCIEK